MLLQVAPDAPDGGARPISAARVSGSFARLRYFFNAPSAPLPLACPSGTCGCCSRAPRGSPAPQPPASPSAASSHDSLQWEQQAPAAPPHWASWAAFKACMGCGGGEGDPVQCVLRVLLRGLQRVPEEGCNTALLYLQYLDDQDALHFLVDTFEEHWHAEDLAGRLTADAAEALRALTGADRDGASVNLKHAKGAIASVIAGSFGVSVAVWERGQEPRLMALASSLSAHAIVLLSREVPGEVGHMSLGRTILGPAEVERVWWGQGRVLYEPREGAEYAGKTAAGKGKGGKKVEPTKHVVTRSVAERGGRKTAPQGGAAAAEAAAPRESCHSDAGQIYSGNAPFSIVKALKNAKTPEVASAASAFLEQPAQAALIEAAAGYARVVCISVPNGPVRRAVGSGCRLDSVLQGVCASVEAARGGGGGGGGGGASQQQFRHFPDALFRTTALRVPAKSRPPCSSAKEADEAGGEEASTIGISPQFSAFMRENPGTCIVVCDDVVCTGVTLCGIKARISTQVPAAHVALVGLHTASNLAGIARCTLAPQASTAAMEATLRGILARGVRERQDKGGNAVYGRIIQYTHRQGLRVVEAIEGDAASSSFWERLWATEWRVNNPRDRGQLLELRYTGQVHTHGKTCDARWQEETAARTARGWCTSWRAALAWPTPAWCC